MHSNVSQYSKQLSFSKCLGYTAPAILLLCIACSNPADDVAEATVEDAAPVAVELPEPVAAEAAGVEYTFVDGTRVGFEGSKVTGSHLGGFENVTGSILLVADDPAQSSIAVEIDMQSTWSDNDRLTGHLKSADFFDVETHSTAVFESSSVTATDSGYSVTGDLSLRGIAKSITFPATIEVADGQVVAKAEFFIKRFDFGIEYPGKVDDLIRDEVVIRLDLVAQPAAS